LDGSGQSRGERKDNNIAYRDVERHGIAAVVFQRDLGRRRRDVVAPIEAPSSDLPGSGIADSATTVQ